MAPKPKKPSPILGAVGVMISEASDTLVTPGSRFQHSFEVDVDRVSADPDQPRRHFAEEDLRSLAESMGQQGQLQPILVRRDTEKKGGWIIVAGERRWRAARMLGWTSVLAIEHAEDHEVATLVENLQRADLNPVEEARGIRRLVDRRGWTQNAAATALGKSKGEVSAILGILALPDAILERVLTSELVLAKNVLVELARVTDQEALTRLLRLAETGQLTVAAIRNATRSARPTRPNASQGPAPLTLRALETIRKSVAVWRSGDRPLKPVERERLEALRREIDAVLGDQ